MGLQFRSRADNSKVSATRSGRALGYSSEIAGQLGDIKLGLLAPGAATERFDVELQRWKQIGPVDFIEVHQDGNGSLTSRVAELGGLMGDPISHQAINYERTWCLEQQADRMDMAWMITERLQPKVIHLGFQDSSPNHALELAIILTEHQDARGLGANLN